MSAKILKILLTSVALVIIANGWSAETDRLGAVGIGVADLERSSAFYADVLGLEVLRTYELGYLNEIDREAGPIDALPGAIVGLGRDPDNHVVEVLKLQGSSTSSTTRNSKCHE